MAEILVVRLSGDDEAEWMSVDLSGARASGVSRGAVADAADMAAQRRVFTLAPADKVLLTSVTLPIRNQAKLRQALPFALEEQVAEDLDKLHFAAGRRTSEGETPVAIVRRDDMGEWLDRLRKGGLEPVAVLAEQAGVPESPTATIWLIEGDRCLVRRPGQPPFFVEGESVDELLLFADPRDDGADTGAHLTVYLGADDQSRHGPDLERLRGELGSLEIQLLPDGTLPHLASAVARDQGVNLLQGEYAPRTGIEKMWRPWRVAAMLLVALIAVVIGRQAAELVRLKKVDTALDQAIQTVFRQAMPDVQRIVNPRRQMETRLRAIRASRGESDAPFLQSLEVLGKAVSATPGSRVESLSFRAGTMEVKLTAPNVDSLDAIQRSIEGAGSFDASILSANPRGDAVEGRIQLVVPEV
jgi:general secretion pathway protein L